MSKILEANDWEVQHNTAIAVKQCESFLIKITSEDRFCRRALIGAKGNYYSSGLCHEMRHASIGLSNSVIQRE
ncbi:MAG: hypothetical protein A2603_03435 [Bdellovibrionales bacterium RIFOXYD1_FULL_55_31]|nr:MAG: hypothetical protein A2603_03435 [Bdellovibrionales bacterium RIFOXYD1_FULL_55_31]